MEFYDETTQNVETDINTLNYTTVHNNLNTTTQGLQTAALSDLEVLAGYIRKICLPIIFVTGIIGNSLTIIILGQKRNRISSTSLYLLSLAVSDLITVIIGNLFVWIQTIWDFHIRDYNTFFCKVHVFFTYLCIHASSWILVLLTAERVLSVLRPHKVRILCCRRNALVALAITIGCLALLNGHFLVGMEQEYSYYTRRNCYGVGEGYINFINNIYPIVDFCVAFAIPCAFILVGNTIILFELAKMARRRKEMVASEQKTNSLTVLLLMLNVLFILSTGPASIYFIIFPYLYDAASPSQIDLLYFIFYIVNVLAGLNACMNFILYFLSGSKFRAEVKALLCCRRNLTQSGAFNECQPQPRKTVTAKQTDENHKRQ